MANDVNNCWAKLDKTTGSGNETLHVYFGENNTGANRSVKIRAYDKTGEAVSEYTLVQLPKEATIYYNTEQTDSFQRTNCPSGYIGTYVEYTIPAGTYSSTVSVEDANRKAREALALEGPAYANVHGDCNQSVWKNQKMTKQYQKTGCDPDTEEGSMVDFTVEAGRFTSTVSQADADKQAEEYLDANGPAYANEHGECITVKWYNEPQSKQYQRTDCDPDTEEGTFVTFSVEAGQFSSNISQKDANDKAIAYLDANGPQYANENGECTTVKWYNDAQSGRFQRTDCLTTETGSFVDYTVEAGRFSSTVSKKDANDQAKAALAIEGPEYANEHGTCEESTWYNEEQRETFYKEGCPAGQIGAPYEYVVEAGKYSSTVSQQDANDKALQEIEDNGQATANLEGECVQDPNYFIGKASARVQKNDCDPETQNGSWVDLTEKDLPGYPDAYVSHTSQPEADALAEAAMELHKQELANEKGTCIDKDLFIGVYSESFQKTDCADGGVGSTVEVDQDDVQEYGPFESYESQEAANDLAKAAVKAHGEEIANRDGYCTWTGTYNENFQKDDCEEGETGSTVNIDQDDVTGGPFTSTESKAAADALAEAAVKEQGQALANQLGNCTDTPVYTGHAEGQYTPECDECFEGVEMTVTAEMVNGGPVTSLVDQPTADAEAERILAEGGQAYANEHGTCNPMDDTPNWVDSDPLETECREGVSYKKQIDQNECSATYNTEQWVPGGDKTCSWVGTCDPRPTQKNDCTDGMSGTIVEVTVEMCEGYPEDFTSTVSEEDANTKACQLLAERAQAVANAEGSCNDCFPVIEKTFYKTDCPSCQEDLTGMLVSVEDVGGPFCAPDYDAETAQTTYDTLAQAYANKNIASCTPKPVEPDWQNVEPAEFECQEGKSMQKQQDMNECSGTYQEFRWVEGGDLTCSWVGTCEGIDKQKDDCEEGKRGTTVHVTVDMCEGYPEDFTSFEGQTEADELACQLLNERAQAVANAQGSCDDCFAIEEKTFYKNDCPNCTEDLVGMFVTEDLVGGPFCSPDYSSENAQSSYEELAQAYVNKNMASESCTPKSTTPVWEDVSPAEYECQSGQSMKKQVDTNECSDSYNTNQWVPGGDLTCQWTAPDSSQQYTTECADSGVGSSVTVQSSELEGYPFVSYESPEDAEALRDAAFEAQGQEIANSKGTCTWTAEYSKSFTGNRTDCPSCQRGGQMSVSSTTLNGSPVTSNISYQDAYNKAQELVESQGQAYADKNAPCESYTESANWQDTGSTRCSGCTSEKQQRDNASCSSTAGTTRWVSGGSRDCSENGTWSTGSWSSYECNGCTYQRHRTRTNSCGASETEWDRSYNYAGCGDWSDYVEDGCGSGSYETYVRYTSTNSCSGEERYNYEQKDGKCGYVACRCTLTVAGPQSTIGYESETNYGLSLGASCCANSEGICEGGDSAQAITSITSNRSWLTNLKNTGTAGLLLIRGDVAENTSSSSRTATVTVKNECGESATFNVTQEGKPSYTFEWYPEESSSKTINLNNSDANNSRLSVSSYKNGAAIGFSCSSNASWLTCDGTTNNDMGWRVTENTTASSRTGTITLTQNESGNKITLIVTQAGKPSGECNLYVDESRTSATSGQFTLSLDISFSQTLGCWDDYNQYYLIMTVTGGTISSGYGRPTSTATDTCSFNIQSGSSNEVANLSGKYAGGHHYYTVYIDLHSGFTSDSCHMAFTIQSTTGNCPCRLVHNYN